MVLGALRPSPLAPYTRPRSFAFVLRFFEVLRLRACASLLRLVAPVIARRPKIGLSPLALFGPNTALSDARKLRRSAATHIAVASDSLIEAHYATDIEPAVVDNNIVSFPTTAAEAIETAPVLEQLCIPIESFHFVNVQRLLDVDGDVIVSADISSGKLKGNSGLCLDQAGRQLSQLGLVAISACNRRRGDTFYVATSASMEEFNSHARIRQPKLTGMVRVTQLQAHAAGVEVELWHRLSLVCRMSVQYDIFSSWQEVLPTAVMTESPLGEHLKRKATHQCIQLIFNAVERQRLPLSVASTASILFQRFFREYSFSEYDRFTVAVSSCCLAAKIEFRSMSQRDLIVATLDERYDREHHPEKFTETAVMSLRTTVHRLEQILLLDVINFDFDMIQGPHEAIAELLAQCRKGLNEQNTLHEIAWALANDSVYTSLSLNLHPAELARGLLSLALQWGGLGDSEWLWSDVTNSVAVREEVTRQMRLLYEAET